MDGGDDAPATISGGLAGAPRSSDTVAAAGSLSVGPHAPDQPNMLFLAMSDAPAVTGLADPGGGSPLAGEGESGVSIDFVDLAALHTLPASAGSGANMDPSSTPSGGAAVGFITSAGHVAGGMMGPDSFYLSQDDPGFTGPV